MTKFPEGDPVEVHPADSRAESQPGLNGPSGSPTSPSGALFSGALSRGRSDMEWALYLGESIVTVYETHDEAADVLAWYVETYGSPSKDLSIGPVRS